MQYNGFQHWWRARTRRRPWWMNALMYFCFYMAIIHIPFDFFFTPVARDEQVWFGIVWRRLGGEDRRAGPLGGVRGRRLRLLAHAHVDVAVGGGVRRPGDLLDGRLVPRSTAAGRAASSPR